ncbi:MAG: aldo/keto reductase [Steroidobacteraceae bacterium]
MQRPISSTLSRREVLATGLLTGVSFSMNSWAADVAKLPLITKTIPATGEKLPVIGLGTIWYRDAQYASLKPVLQRMGELGGTLIDTAAAYGESEGVIGKALAELGTRNKMFIATKFNDGSNDAPATNAMSAASAPPAGNATPLPGPPQGITRPDRDGVVGQASFERSLQRLQTDHIDLLQVHGMNGTDVLMPLLLEWKRAKKIRYIGVTTSSTNQHQQLIQTMQRYPLDFIQVDYSIGNRAAEAALAVASERKVAVLANLPLGRATLLQAVANRPLPAWAAEIDVSSWSQFLLKYVVSHPAVTCAIPGTTNVEHLQDNLLAGRGRLPDTSMRKRMEALWETLSK